jgi:hypothetical protein
MDIPNFQTRKSITKEYLRTPGAEVYFLLTLPYSEHFCTASRAGAPYGRPSIFQGDFFRVYRFHFFPAFKAIRLHDFASL